MVDEGAYQPSAMLHSENYVPMLQASMFLASSPGPRPKGARRQSPSLAQTTDLAAPHTPEPKKHACVAVCFPSLSQLVRVQLPVPGHARAEASLVLGTDTAVALRGPSRGIG